MGGLGDNKFGPKDKLTRAQMAQLLLTHTVSKLTKTTKLSMTSMVYLGQLQNLQLKLLQA